MCSCHGRKRLLPVHWKLLNNEKQRLSRRLLTPAKTQQCDQRLNNVVFVLSMFWILHPPAALVCEDSCIKLDQRAPRR